MDVPALRRRLLAWYRRERRDLPWRGRDVYGVWVSEVMLQQTRVDVATPYYLRWMERFPTVQALAKAKEEDVLRLWAGLGYYSRARNLHAAAKTVAKDGWPEDLDGWRALPGIGPYTAAAITSIAQGQPNACVDGNVVRVVSRLADEHGDVTKAAVRANIEGDAQRWLAPRAPGDWNQAMMDLGATICTPKTPRCGACPVVDLCAAHKAGTQGLLPRKSPAKKPVEEKRSVAVVRRRGKVLLVRPSQGLLAGLWALPGGAADEPLADTVLRQSGVRIRAGPARGHAIHQFSHRTWRIAVHHGEVVATPGGATHETRWVREADLHGEAVPAATKVALAAAGVATKAKTGRASARP